MSKHKQNNVSAFRTVGLDLNYRWQKISKLLSQKTGFTPSETSVRRIAWWNTEKVASVSIQGSLPSGESVILKIQGTKPNTSEFVIIDEFQKQNKSKLIRPPKVFHAFPWNDKLQFEAFVCEKIEGTFPLTNRPVAQLQLRRFFKIYEEYSENCRNNPWLARPSAFENAKRVKVWLSAVESDRSKDKYFSKQDLELAEAASGILDKYINPSNMKFVHGHFQNGDLHIISDQEIVLTSNLFWGWRNPFYDAVFGYHWWMLGMEHLDNLTEDLLEKERQKWFHHLFSLKKVRSKKEGEKFLHLALLERAIPALLVDRFLNDQTKPSSEIIAEGARKELRRLVKEFS